MNAQLVCGVSSTPPGLRLAEGCARRRFLMPRMAGMSQYEETDCFVVASSDRYEIPCYVSYLAAKHGVWRFRLDRQYCVSAAVDSSGSTAGITLSGWAAPRYASVGPPRRLADP